ncbi:MAG: response regulator transcription factor [Anaerolineae bacterium]|nr:response regulator transcription factor [Anaerolineae bacterium]
MTERCRVLIADDSVAARRGLRAVLHLRPEIEIVGEAADGLEAVEVARDSRPDVVLMDMRMPLIDGLEAAQRIKALAPQIRVVITSMDAHHRAAALAAGVDAFVVKGGSADDLLSAILDRAIPEG